MRFAERYFVNLVFCVRKHDPAQRLVMLRSDKILTTSLLGRLSVKDRIAGPKEIHVRLSDLQPVDSHE